jgi:hypothetical protein
LPIQENEKEAPSFAIVGSVSDTFAFGAASALDTKVALAKPMQVRTTALIDHSLIVL